MSILIIDDSALHLRLIEDILQNAGFIDTIAIDSIRKPIVAVELIARVSMALTRLILMPSMR